MEIVLKSGAEVYANLGLISVGYDTALDNGWVLTGGYDQTLWTEDLSNEDKREIADMMIARWTAFRDSLAGAP